MRHYKNKSLQTFYEACRKLGADPQSEFYFTDRDGITRRPRRGAGHRHAYWNGRQGAPNLLWSRGTFAYVAYMAGRDDARCGPVQP
jgi:hypothetical protein